jgi:LmbE family N-acetylglucosaminyl deacetylase
MNGSVFMMAVAPHPGDAEWGIGGTVARWTRQGKNIIYVVCANGDKASRYPTKPEELAAIREEEQIAAAKIVGVTAIVFLRHPDLSIEGMPELKKEILRLILRYRPEVVATCDPHYGYFSHPDHRSTGRATLDAIWPYAMASNSYPELLDEGLQVHKVKEVLLWQAQEANCCYDISQTLDLKIAALTCLKSQLGDQMAPEDSEYIKGIALKAAKGQQYTLGEAFHRIAVPQRI